MNLFGITGPIGHGKTTLAEALLKLENPSRHIETSTLVSSVANEWFATFPKELLIDPMDYSILDKWIDDLAKVVSHQLIHVMPHQLSFTRRDVLEQPKYYYKFFMHLNLVRQGVIGIGDPITVNTKERHRTILQWLGGYLVYKIGPGIWYDEIERQLHQAETEGVRLLVVGGVRYPYDANVIRRNGGKIIQLIRADLPERELADITEEHRHEIIPDTTIISDASPQALIELVKAFYQDLLLGDLLPQYNSNDFAPLS